LRAIKRRKTIYRCEDRFEIEKKFFTFLRKQESGDERRKLEKCVNVSCGMENSFSTKNNNEKMERGGLR
jgi:hypothetical protein